MFGFLKRNATSPEAVESMENVVGEMQSGELQKKEQKYNDQQLDGMVALISEAYRLRLFIGSVLPAIENEKTVKRAMNQMARFDKYFIQGLNQTGLQLLDFTGMPYEIGLPVEPINLDDFGHDDELLIEAMLEPTIKFADKADIVKRGIVVLRRNE